MILCFVGTYANKKGASNCAPCPKNTYAANDRSTQCIPCGETQYSGINMSPFRMIFHTSTCISDEGSSKCTERPKCEEKHYQKVFTGCDASMMVCFNVCLFDYVVFIFTLGNNYISTYSTEDLYW